MPGAGQQRGDRVPLKAKVARFEHTNDAAARVILANPERYGGEGSAAVLWARAFMERQQTNDSGEKP